MPWAAKTEPGLQRSGADVEARVSDETPALDTSSPRSRSPFSTIGLVALIVFLLVIVWLAGRLLLLVFAGVLLAVFLRLGASLVGRLTRLGNGWSLLVFIVLLVGSLVLGGWFFFPRVAEQVRDLTEAVPNAVNELADRLGETAWGGWILDYVRDNDAMPDDGRLVEHATTFAYGLFDAVFAFVVILFVGLYLSAAPVDYARGLLRLVPKPRRRRVAEFLFAAGYQLRWWLGGQLVAMAFVGTFIGVGLALIGVPLALALGLLAGLFEFIPTIGPPLAILPAVLLALVDDSQKAIYVLMLWGAVQIIEPYFLTPLIQRRAVHLQPVVTVTAQVFFAWTMGPLGLLVAVPLIAVIQIAVQMFYVEDVLGDEMKLDPEKIGRRELEESGILD
jgi:predicted PurR-regulated permease PerM